MTATSTNWGALRRAYNGRMSAALINKPARSADEWATRLATSRPLAMTASPAQRLASSQRLIPRSMQAD